MSNDQNTYRPRSPDFSASSSHQPPQPPPRLSRLPSYQIQEPSLPKGYSFSPRGSYDASPFFSPVTQQPSASYFNFPPTTSPQSAHSQLPRTNSQPPVVFEPVFSQSPSRSQIINSIEPCFRPIPPNSHQHVFEHESIQQAYDEMARLRQRKVIDYNENHREQPEYDDRLPPPPPPMLDQGHMPLQPSTFNQSFDQGIQRQLLPIPVAMTLPKVDVRTKFPVARIKRIMQADEDVGKVAQATPSAVSKALELFMIALVTKGATEAKYQNSKRVTATHLKVALLKDSQFDFLNEVCEAAPEEGPKKRTKSDAKDSDSEEEGESKKKGKGRRKKTGSEMESD